MDGDIELSPLAALADLPGAALRLVLPLGAAIALCFFVLLGAMVANPYAALTFPERESIDPAPLAQAPAVPSGPSGEGASGLAAAVVQAVRAQIGKPYVWGAAGPNSFDCSGLTQWAWAQVGVHIPHFTVDQYRTLQPVAADQLQPGDLVFFNICCDQPGVVPSHVGLYVGNGRMVHAPQPGEPVQEVSLDTPFWRSVWYGAARPRLAGG